MNEQQSGVTMEPVVEAIEELRRARDAQKNAKKRMDRAWAEYCHARSEWERLGREGSDAFNKIIAPHP